MEDARQRLVDRADVSDALYRYCSCVDRRDWSGLRKVIADDARMRYGNGEWIEGGDTIVGLLQSATAESLWSHHLVSVYHVDVDGDEASTLTYSTSHQVSAADPTTAWVVVGRYHDRLRRAPEGWKISAKLMEILWAGPRTDPGGRLEAMGGRGPAEVDFS